MFGAELRVLHPGLLPIHDPARGEDSEDGDSCVWQFHRMDAGRAQGTATVSHSLSWSHTTVSVVASWLLRPALADDGGTARGVGGWGEQREEGHWGQ